MDYELLFLKSLGLTVLIETFVTIIFFRLLFRQKEIKISGLIITGFIASFATLPYLWFVFPVYLKHKIWYVIIGESFAVLTETMIIGAILRAGFIKSFLCPLACNSISFLTGLLIY